MGAFFQCNIKQYNDINKYIDEYSDFDFINITSVGKSLSEVKNNNKMSLIFSSKPIENNKVNHVLFKQDISLDNIVNIVLFNLYN